MIEGRPSETALHTAAARAAHNLLDPEPHILEDLRAAELLGSDGAALIETQVAGRTLALDDGDHASRGGVSVRGRAFARLRGVATANTSFGLGP